MPRVRKLTAFEPIIIEGYLNGTSIDDLATVHGASPGTVRNILIRNGVPIRTQGRKGPVSDKPHTEYFGNNKRIPSTEKAKWTAVRDDPSTVCAICNERTSVMEIDHDHKTGKVRGILCRQHNIGLGFFTDSKELLESAIQYLNPPKPKDK